MIYNEKVNEIYWDYDGFFGDTMTPSIEEMKELGFNGTPYTI